MNDDGEVNDYKDTHDHTDDDLSRLVDQSAFFLGSFFFNCYLGHARCDTMVIFLVQEDVNKDVDKDNHSNVDNKDKEPDVNVLKIGSLGK